MSQLSRRTFLAGAAAPLTLPAGTSRTAQIAAAGDLHPLMAATWQQATNDATISDAANNTLNSRARCVAPAGSGLRDIVLAFPAWGLNTTEKPWPTPFAVTASVEYPEGTFHPVYVAGRRVLTIVPGAAAPMFEPCPIEIPAGAVFYVKCFAAWTGSFWMGRSQACVPGLGEWTHRGLGQADETTTTAVLQTTALAAGFRPAVFARLHNPLVVLGILGASQEMAYAADASDPDTGAVFIGRAMRNQFPVLNMSRAGDSLGQYLYQPAARRAFLKGRITHLILALGSNDIFAGIAVDKTLSWLKRAADPYLADGLRVYGMTVLPRSHSTDGWATKVNQTPVNATFEAARVDYNTRLLHDWRAMGFAGMFDCGHAIDPADRGIWGADELSTGRGGGGFATLLNGSVTEVQLGPHTDNGVYPANAAVPCVALNAPGDSVGAGAVATMHTDRNGRGVAFSVESGGAGYHYPPLIAAKGQWCSNDGVHECKRGYDLVIAGCNLGPHSFLP